MQGYFNYHGVPGNMAALDAFQYGDHAIAGCALYEDVASVTG